MYNGYNKVKAKTQYCNEDEPQGAQKAPFRAGPFCFDLVKGEMLVYKKERRFVLEILFTC